MKIPLNVAGFIPKSAKIAPIAPSTLIGSAFFASANHFYGSRCSHVDTINPGLARKLEQARCPWILGVIAMTEPGHSIARFFHCAQGPTRGFIQGNGLRHGAIRDFLQVAGAIFNRAAMISVDRHNACANSGAQ